MDIFYFSSTLTPHLNPFIEELGLTEKLPFNIDKDMKCDLIVNEFFLSLIGPQSPSPQTWKTYAEQLSLFFRFLSSQGKNWRYVEHSDFLAYYRIRRVKDGPLKITARSWNLFSAASRRFYEWAVRKKYIAVVPFEYKEIYFSRNFSSKSKSAVATNISDKVREKDIKYITEEDFLERLLPVVTKTKLGTRNALFVRLLMRSGLRAIEAVTLKISMLPDPDEPRFRGRLTCPMKIVGKGQKERVVRVPKSWLRDARRYTEWERADAIGNWIDRHKFGNAPSDGHKDYFFLTEAGTPVCYSTMYAMMRKCGEKAGFNFSTHPHALRHSYAVYQLSAMIRKLLALKNNDRNTLGEVYRGMVQDPLRKLQKLMGHSSIESTFIYLDYSDELDDLSDISSDVELGGDADGYDDIGDCDV